MPTASSRPSAGGRPRPSIDYLPIAEHGIIGDLHSIALVGTDGRIDWYCCPSFDSPSVFGAILGEDTRRLLPHRAGRRRLGAPSSSTPRHNVLVTRFLTPVGIGEVQDFMPIASGAGGAPPAAGSGVCSACGGRCAFRVDVRASLRLRAGAARDASSTKRASLPLARALARPRDARADVFAEDGAYGEFTLLPGETATFVLEQVPEDVRPAQVLRGRDA